MAKPVHLIAQNESQAARLRAAWPDVQVITSMTLPPWWPQGLKYEDYFQDMISKGWAYRLDLHTCFPAPETMNEL